MTEQIGNLNRLNSESSDGFRARFGAYVLFQRIGEGGSANVYLGRRAGAAGFGSWVAVKILHAHLLTCERSRRAFENESRVLAKLDHPNVSRMLDFGSVDGRPFLVTEYLHGEPLSRLMGRLSRKNVMLPLEVIVWMFTELLVGLYYVHTATGASGGLGLVHRDLSPRNIFITLQGQVKLIDFGITQRGDDRSQAPVAGTHAYMSPEQIRGLPLDARSDLFSVGVVLWEVLASRRLFKRDTPVQTIQAAAKCEPPRLESLNPNVPPALADVVHRALSKSAGDRPSDAFQLLVALMQAVPSVSAPQDAAMADLMQRIFSERMQDNDVAFDVTPSGVQTRVDEDASEEKTQMAKTPSSAVIRRAATRVATGQIECVEHLEGQTRAAPADQPQMVWSMESWSPPKPKAQPVAPAIPAAQNRPPQVFFVMFMVCFVISGAVLGLAL